LLFPAAVFLGAGSIVVLRTPTVPSYSTWSARGFFGLALTYGAFAGLQLFKNYAWINETAFISFAVSILIISIIGVNRWGEMDETTPTQRRTAPVAAPRSDFDTGEVPVVRKTKPKARARKAAPRKR
jgi:hypothetical protein